MRDNRRAVMLCRDASREESHPGQEPDGFIYMGGEGWDSPRGLAELGHQDIPKQCHMAEKDLELALSNRTGYTD